MKKNIADLWWRAFIERRADCMGIDTPVLLPGQVWEASGHVDNFTDPLSECRKCHHRFRWVAAAAGSAGAAL